MKRRAVEHEIFGLTYYYYYYYVGTVHADGLYFVLFFLDEHYVRIDIKTDKRIDMIYLYIHTGACKTAIAVMQTSVKRFFAARRWRGKLCQHTLKKTHTHNIHARACVCVWYCCDESKIGFRR